MSEFSEKLRRSIYEAKDGDFSPEAHALPIARLARQLVLVAQELHGAGPAAPRDELTGRDQLVPKAFAMALITWVAQQWKSGALSREEAGGFIFNLVKFFQGIAMFALLTDSTGEQLESIALNIPLKEEKLA